MHDLPAADLTDGIAHTGMAWRIHRERVLLAGWGRAILLQIAHPMVAQGVADHSRFTTEPWGWLRRLDRTLRSMLALTFGTDAQAAVAAAPFCFRALFKKLFFLLIVLCACLQ